MHPVILSILADDRPGIVETLSDCVAAHHGNWLESRMANLAGKFAGIVRLEVDDAHRAALITGLEALVEQGIRVTIDEAASTESNQAEWVSLLVTGSDRPGIVREITALLARQWVNVQDLSTHCELAPMSGDRLFQARLQVVLPERLSIDQLAQSLERISDDLLVDLDEPGPAS